MEGGGSGGLTGNYGISPLQGIKNKAGDDFEVVVLDYSAGLHGNYIGLASRLLMGFHCFSSDASYLTGGDYEKMYSSISFTNCFSSYCLRFGYFWFTHLGTLDYHSNNEHSSAYQHCPSNNQSIGL